MFHENKTQETTENVCLASGRAAETKRDVDSGSGSYQDDSEDSAVGGTSVAAEAEGGATSYSSYTQTGGGSGGYQNAEGTPAAPSYSSTSGHSTFPSYSPTSGQSSFPSYSPTSGHSSFPSYSPTSGHSSFPSYSPTSGHSSFPSYSPTSGQSSFPSYSPTSGHTVFPTQSYGSQGGFTPSSSFQPSPISTPLFTPGHGTFSNQFPSIHSSTNFVNSASFPQGSPSFGGQINPHFGSAFPTHAASAFRNPSLFGSNSIPHSFNGQAASFPGRHFGTPSFPNFAPSFSGHSFPQFRGQIGSSFGGHLAANAFPGQNFHTASYAPAFQNSAPILPSNFASHGAGGFFSGAQATYPGTGNSATYSDTGSRTSSYGDYTSGDITSNGATSEADHNDAGPVNNDHGSSRVASDSNDGVEGATGHKATSYQSFVLHSYHSPKREGKVETARHRSDDKNDAKASDHF
ncbi:hypothetical protein AAG570_008656 [Ranatra chinensis]|uniref:Uncharacterized protein n=1 Tax=Ranatra chinensis TaxID=642074 RepID=A0ABD0ZCP5_9HEMI